MFSFDLQMGLAKAWTDAALDCMTASTSAALDMTNQTLALWSRTPEDVVPPASPAKRTADPEPQTRSWYRAPSQSPFEFGSSGPAGALPLPFSLGWPVMPPIGQFMWPGLPAFPQLLQSWTAMMTAAGGFAFPPRPTLNGGAFAMPGLPWFWSGLPSVLNPLAAREPSAPFSVYRSDGGHAVAQVTFPNQVIAAVAFPPMAAMLMPGLFRLH